MHLIYADDSRQLHPTRLGMGPLVGIGGVHVPEQSARHLATELDRLCRDAGFPPGAEFKWSPHRKSWMSTHLQDEARLDFFRSVLTVAGLLGVQVTVVIADAKCKPAIRTSSSPEVDVTTMFLERADNALRMVGEQGLVVVDRPGGNRATEDRFFAWCSQTLTVGTTYVLPTNIVTVLSGASHLERALQLADVVTGCTLARVAGEHTHSPSVFEMVRPLFRRDSNRIGGIGLKLHPDYKYANLYHWLVGDRVWLKGNMGWDLPHPDIRYSASAGEAA